MNPLWRLMFLLEDCGKIGAICCILLEVEQVQMKNLWEPSVLNSNETHVMLEELSTELHLYTVHFWTRHRSDPIFQEHSHPGLCS